jgi:hypothetical protein
MYNDKNRGTHLVSRCKALEARLEQLLDKSKKVENYKKMLLEDSFGTIDHV